MSIDPIESNDITDLRREILRLRDLVLGGQAENGVLRARIADLEHEGHRVANMGQAFHDLSVEADRLRAMVAERDIEISRLTNDVDRLHLLNRRVGDSRWWKAGQRVFGNERLPDVDP